MNACGDAHNIVLVWCLCFDGLDPLARGKKMFFVGFSVHIVVLVWHHGDTCTVPIFNDSFHLCTVHSSDDYSYLDVSKCRRCVLTELLRCLSH